MALVFIAEEQVRGPVELRLRWRQAERRWREHPLAVWTTPTEKSNATEFGMLPLQLGLLQAAPGLHGATVYGNERKYM